MNAFCTLFDSTYLTRGIALHESLIQVESDFLLIIYCFDDYTLDLLTRLNLPNVKLVSLREFETPELLAIKNTRTRGEYAWTCGSHSILDALRRFQLPEVTYVDSDVYFFKDPSILIQEFHEAKASILITEHRYHPSYKRAEINGKYCVQFMTFKNDPPGMECLLWWTERCREWCYARLEDGKFGDQKYLDDWPIRFRGVHALKNIGGGLGPWNILNYQISEGPLVDGVPAVFYHFHNFKLYSDDRYDLCSSTFKLSPASINQFYKPYLAAFKRARIRVRECDPEYRRDIFSSPKSFLQCLRKLKKQVLGRDYVVQK